jgi:hypothetical protein
MKVERSKNRLYYLELDRVDPICDGILVEEQRSAPFPIESTHVTQDISCEGEKSGQPEESPENSRPPWPEEGELKEKGSSEEDLLEGPSKRKIRYVCSELLNLAVASIIENRTHTGDLGNCRPTRPEEGQARNPQAKLLDGLVSPETLSPESRPAGCRVRTKTEERSCPAAHVLDELEGDVLPRNTTKKEHAGYVCLELIKLACIWMRYGQKHRLESHPSSRELDSFACNGRMHARVYLNEKVLRQEHKGESSGSDVGCQPAKEGLKSEERSATSSAEEYVVSAPIALELKQLQPTLTRMRRVLDCYPKNPFRTVNNPVKMKHEKQYVLIEELVKTGEADKKDGRHEAMEKPAKAKTVTWMRQGATKAMSTIMTKSAKVVPRVTPTRSKWRIWNPGRNEAFVLRGVIVSIKHVRCSVLYTKRIRIRSG